MANLIHCISFTWGWVMHSKLVLILALLLPIVTGCDMQRTVLPVSAVSAFSDPDAELDFLDQLETLSVVSNNDALHGLLLLEGGAGEQQQFAERQAEAVRRGWIPATMSLVPNESA